jgi:hypothetical protein
MKLHEYAGVIHLHSTYSDGSGCIPTILQAAQDVDFLMLTDHNTLAARRDGWEGWHGNTLLIVGEEVTTTEGDCLTFGTQTRIAPYQNASQCLTNINRQQGLSFLAHPHGTYKPLFKTIDHSWKDWSQDSFTGLEVWSYMFDWVSTFKYHKWWDHYFHPKRHIHGPHPNTLEMWDKISQKRKCVAIGGVDAHAKKHPILPLTVFPYKELFQTIKTHVLIHQPLPKDNPQQAIKAILKSLQQGHCYLAYHPLGNPTGTRFQAANQCLIMGDETHFNKPNSSLTLQFQTPQAATLRLFKNGHKIHEKYGNSLDLTTFEPGVYRAEARVNNKPWILTNPIHIRPNKT